MLQQVLTCGEIKLSSPFKSNSQMDIKPLEQTDVKMLSELQPPGWDIMSIIDLYTKADFCFPIKVTIDQKIIGIGTTIIHNDVAWLAHIIVHDQYRNQGIGRLITQTLMDRADAERCGTIYLLATEMGEPVYTKLGFETETEYVSFKGEKITGQPADDTIMAYKIDYKDQISKLDRLVSGEERMFHLEPYLSAGLVYLQDNKVVGYYLPTFGDGLIIAGTVQAGEALMRLRMTTKDFAVFPVENVLATAFMAKHNFNFFRTQKRMRFGKKRDWQPANIFNRIGGNLG